jgi:hypothetical protein
VVSHPLTFMADQDDIQRDLKQLEAELKRL